MVSASSTIPIVIKKYVCCKQMSDQSCSVVFYSNVTKSVTTSFMIIIKSDFVKSRNVNLSLNKFKNSF